MEAAWPAWEAASGVAVVGAFHKAPKQGQASKPPEPEVAVGKWHRQMDHNEHAEEEVVVVEAELEVGSFQLNLRY